MIALIITLIFAAPEAPPTETICSYDAEAREVVCVAVERRTRSVTSDGTDLKIDIDGDGPLPLIWSRERMTGLPVDPVPCLRTEVTTDNGVQTILTIYGVEWVVTITNRETGHVVGVWTVCEWDGDTPPPPPAPPTPPDEMAIDAEALHHIETELSPHPDKYGGISQLPTWFWCNQPGPVQLDATTTGTRSTADIAMTGVHWTIDGPDGTIERDADHCGTDPDPYGNGDEAAAHWTPNLTGDYTISLATTWTGTWQVDIWIPNIGWVDAGTFNFDPVIVELDDTAYTVIEIQTIGRHG